MSDFVDEPTAEDGGVTIQYKSLEALRNTHTELLKRHREAGNDPELLAEISDFVHHGQATGALLDAEDERWDAQSLLDYWATVLHRAGQGLPDATLADFDPAYALHLDDADCPYRGLDAFGEAHSRHFFGRQRQVDELVAHVKDHRLLALVGSSGCGKSSLVLAGLLAALKAGRLPGSQAWHYFPPMVPGSNPLEYLARIVRPAGAVPAGWDVEQARQMEDDPGHLASLVKQQCEGPAVLVIDQFEEIFTLCGSKEIRQAFVDNLSHLIQAPGARHTVILTMRIDFEHRIRELAEFQPAFEEAVVYVRPMSAGELRDAIEEPARLVQLKFEEGLVEDLLKQVLPEPVALPLLQFTLLKLWENRDHNWITWESYRKVGAPGEALKRSADQFYESLIPEQRELARRILLRMVRPAEAQDFTSNRIRREKLYAPGEDRDRIDRVLAKLVMARLVRLTEGKTRAEDQVEVAHEALVRNWPRLVGWLKEEREAIGQRLRLTAAAEHWQSLQRDAAALWRGSLLESAQTYPDLNELEAEFVQASKDLVEAERQNELRRERELAKAEAEARAAKRLRRLVVALAVVSLLAVAMAVFAGYQWSSAQRSATTARKRESDARAAQQLAETESARADRSSEEARVREKEARAAQELAEAESTRANLSSEIAKARESEARAAQELAEAESARAERQLRSSASRGLAAIALNQLEMDPERSILLAVEAASMTREDQTVMSEAEDALHHAIQTSRVQLALSGHTARIDGVAFSPDGSRLATASWDNTAKVWDAATGELLLTLSGHDYELTDVAFSPDGGRLATASWDTTARVWDATTGEPLLTLASHDGSLTGVTFSSDGSRLATASWDNTAKVWDATRGEVLFTLEGHSAPVRAVAFSPDGTRLATASDDNTAKVWDADTGSVLLTLTGHERGVYDIAFSPDGTRLATASLDDTARLWDAATGVSLRSFAGHLSMLEGVAFSSDGTRIATSSWDRTAKVWDVESGEVLIDLAGHTDAILDVAFSPDGTRLATAGMGGSARVWNIAAVQELRTLSGHGDGVGEATFSPDGARLATAGWDNTAKVWDATTGEVLLTLPGHGFWVSGIAFNHDGTRLATASGDGTAQVWDAVTGALLLTFEGDDDPLDSVAFSPDGNRLATASRDGTAREWDAVTGEMLRTLSDHDNIVRMVTYSPDGTRLATANSDATAKLWDADTGETLCTLEGHSNDVFAVAFSPDGERMATAGADGTARLWDAHGGQALLSLQGHIGEIWDIAFSPDGLRLATAGRDMTVRVWDATSGRPLFTLSGHTDTVTDVTFSPDGKRLASASADGTVRLYTMDTEELLALACSRVTRNLTQAEWLLAFAPEAPYHQTCPSQPVHATVIQEYVREGRTDDALAALRQAAELDPSLGFVPEEQLAQLLVRQAEESVALDVPDKALIALEEAQGLDPSLGLVPAAEVARLLISRSRDQAEDGKYEAALASLQQAFGFCDEPDEPIAGLAGEIADAYAIACLRDLPASAEERSPVCQGAVELAVELDQPYLNHIVCLNRAQDLDGGYATICEHADAFAIPIAFGTSVAGAVEAYSRYIWTLDGRAGQVVTVRMDGGDGALDPYLLLLGPDGTVLAEDDDSGGDRNSLIERFALPESGLYTIVAQGYADSAGEYTLAVLEETD